MNLKASARHFGVLTSKKTIETLLSEDYVAFLYYPELRNRNF
jgi:hypothetical protein